MVRRITVGLFSVEHDTGTSTVKAEYFAWWFANQPRLMRVALENEERVAAQARAVRPDCEEDVFLLQFVLQNAVFRFQDPLVYGPIIVFFHESLPAHLDQRDQNEIVFEKPYDRNYPLYRLVEMLVAGRSNVRIVTPRPPEHAFMIERGFPFLTRTLYGVETALGTVARVIKPRHRHEARTVILSNFRHSARLDENNLFWGNVVRLLPQTRVPPADIVYYNQVLPVQRTYYFHLLFDRRHTYLTECLTARRFRADMRTYRGIRLPETFSYHYKGVDYGEVLLPLVRAYYRILYPFILRHRSTLRSLLAAKPAGVWIDSELSFPGFHLGFMDRRCPLIVLTNEVVNSRYAMLPHGSGRVRPTFDAKLVSGARERDVLVREYGYDRRSLFILPDPRYLDAILRERPSRSVVLFISQSNITEPILAIGAAFHRQHLERGLEFIVKPHPLEAPGELAKRLPAIMFCDEKRLSFVPKYAISHSSTLGIELLFQGSVVFFLEGTTFDVTREIPFLFAKDAATVVERIARLERDPTFARDLRRRIHAHLVKQYKVLSRESCVAAINTMEATMEKKFKNKRIIS